MGITLRSVAEVALTHTQADVNFSSFVYSASLSGNILSLHYTGSSRLDRGIIPEPRSLPITLPSTTYSLVTQTGATNTTVITLSGSDLSTDSITISGTQDQTTVSKVGETIQIGLPSSVTISGNMTAAGFFNSSDIRLKTLIDKTFDPTEIKAITYTWKDSEDRRERVGYSAQQVQEFMPDAVEEREGVLTVNYIDVLVAKIAALEKRVKDLENGLE